MTRLGAHHPNALPKRWSELSERHVPGIIEAIARNPGTPREILLWLVETHPQAVLENPVLPLLLLETPTLFHELGRRGGI